MYYITNHTGHIIAAGEALLSHLDIKDINAFNKDVILGNLTFSTSDEERVDIVHHKNQHHYAMSSTALRSILGELQLIQLSSIVEKSSSVEQETSTLSSIDDVVAQTSHTTKAYDTSKIISSVASDALYNPIGHLDLDNIAINPTKEEETQDDSKDDDSKEESSFDMKSDIVEDTLKEDADVSYSTSNFSSDLKLDEEDEIAYSSEKINALIDLDEDKEESPEVALSTQFTPETNYDDEAIASMIEYDTEEKEETFAPSSQIAENISMDDHSPIHIDVEHISKEIGISTEDYHTFLNEYIDTSLNLESSLQSVNKEKRTVAIGTLVQLADVLNLPLVNGIISKLKKVSHEKSQDIIELFYTTLSRFTLEKSIKEESEITLPQSTASSSTKKYHFNEDIEIELDEENSYAFNAQNTPSPRIESSYKQQEEESEEEHSSIMNLELVEIEPDYKPDDTNIDQRDIKAIRFYFNLQDAADDLSLPVDLIEEFVRDFIEQAHIETEKMLSAYKNKDLDTIQKIGHLLKGASSNLRINPLSETLSRIQFCEEFSDMKPLIVRYWGQLIAFTEQINQNEKKRK